MITKAFGGFIANSTADAEWLKQLGIGGLFAVVLIGIVLQFVLRYSSVRHAHPSGSNGRSGEKSVEYWQVAIGAIVQKNIEARLVPMMQTTRDDQARINEILRERLHTLVNTMQRVESKVDELLRKKS